jgi:hypothetical protein
MSVLDLDTLFNIVNRTYPTSAQIAAVQVILETPQVIDGLDAATERVIAIRKAHLDEVASTVSPPVDDTVDLSDQIRRLIISPYMSWAAESRPYIQRLIVAFSTSQVSVTPVTGDLDILNDVLVKLGVLNGSVTPARKIRTMVELNNGYPISYVKPSSVNGAVEQFTNANETQPWSGIRSNMATNFHNWTGDADYSSLSSGGNKVHTSGKTATYSNLQEAYGALTYKINDLIDAYCASPGVSPFSLSTATVPTLIADYASMWSQVFAFLRGEINTYANETYKYISDTDFSALQSAYSAL